ncbi:MAG: Rubrerythrin [Firmicutes bacterium]|nr:Rubrerythrin [Bacillota bacterium]
MSSFGNPISGLVKDRKITEQELIRAIRIMIAAEYETIHLYTQLAETTE